MLVLFVSAVASVSCGMVFGPSPAERVCGVTVRDFTGIGDSPREAEGSDEAMSSAQEYFLGPVVDGDISAHITVSGATVRASARQLRTADTTMIAEGRWPDGCLVQVYRWTSPVPDRSWSVTPAQRAQLAAGRAEVVELVVTCGR